jgi:hypothetical protein
MHTAPFLGRFFFYADSVIFQYVQGEKNSPVNTGELETIAYLITKLHKFTT